MQRIVCVLAAAAFLVSSSTGAYARPTGTDAPAERTFGQRNLTIVDVRRGLDTLAARIATRPTEARIVYARAVLVEDALRDWARHFPQDPWIPGCAFALAQLYGELDVLDSGTRKNAALDWLITAYPASDYAQMGRI